LVEEKLEFGSLQECLSSVFSLNWIDKKEKGFIEWVLNYYINLNEIKQQIASNSLCEADRSELVKKLNDSSKKMLHEQQSKSEKAEKSKRHLAEKSKSIMLNQINKMKDKFLKMSLLDLNTGSSLVDDENLVEKDSEITKQ
jgi:DNA-binding transcriptional MerR regulator